MRKASYKALFFYTALFCSGSAYASPAFINSVMPAHFLVTASVGADFVNVGQTKNVTLLPPFENRYVDQTGIQSLFDGGVFLGAEWFVSPLFSWQLGVAGYRTSSMDVTGDVWQFADPNYDNFDYTYNIVNERLVAETKLLTTVYERVHPYISGQLGASRNMTSNFDEKPDTCSAVPGSPFEDHNTTAFTYGVGAGVDVDLTKHLRLGAGYQFADLGRASLGSASTAATNDSLSVSHMYTQELRVQLTLVI